MRSKVASFAKTLMVLVFCCSVWQLNGFCSVRGSYKITSMDIVSSGGVRNQKHCNDRDARVIKQFLLKKAVEKAGCDPIVSITAYNQKLGDVLLSLLSRLGYSVEFGIGVNPNSPVMVSIKNEPLSQAVKEICGYCNYGVSFDFVKKKVLVTRFIEKVIEIPVAVLNGSKMSSSMGGNMSGGSSGGFSGGAGSVGGGGGGSSSSLDSSVHLKQEFDSTSVKNDFVANINNMLSPGGRVYFDWSAGVLEVYDTPYNVSMIEKYVKSVRKRADRMVRIEAVLMEVKESRQNQHGIDWDFIAKHMLGAARHFEITTNYGSMISSPGTIITTNSGDLNTVVHLISEQGQTRILSRPYIFVRNLQPVSLFSGKSIPYLDQVTHTVTGTSGTEDFSYTTSTVEDGIMLGLWCHIRDDGLIDVQITPVLSNVEEYVDLSIGGDKIHRPVPVVQQTVQTVTVKPGSIIVIGGLKKNVVLEKKKGIPLLSNIPILGSLFRYQSKEHDNSEFVITLKVGKVVE